MTSITYNEEQWRPDVLWPCPYELIVKENCQPKIAAKLGIFNKWGEEHFLKIVSLVVKGR